MAAISRVRVISRTTTAACSIPSGERWRELDGELGEAFALGSEVDQRHETGVMEVGPDDDDSSYEVGPTSRDDERDVAPVAVPEEVDHATEVFDKGNGLVGHGLVTEGFLGVSRATVPSSIEGAEDKLVFRYGPTARIMLALSLRPPCNRTRVRPRFLGIFAQVGWPFKTIRVTLKAYCVTKVPLLCLPNLW